MTRRVILSHFSRVWLCATLWTVACQAPLSMGFSRQEYWSELPYPPPEDLPDPGIETVSLISPAMGCLLNLLPVHGILQAGILEWVAMPSSKGSSQPRDQTHISYLLLPWQVFFTTSTTWESQKRGRKIVLKHCWSTTPRYFQQFHRFTIKDA